jgi:hypothetical protein
MQHQYKDLIKDGTSGGDVNKTRLSKSPAKSKIDTGKKSKNVVDRLANNPNDLSEESAINVEDNLQIRY